MRAWVFALLGLVALGCPKNDVINPPVGEGTDYPCGYHARRCEISGLCCEEESDCPGTFSCPKTTEDGPHCCGHATAPPVPTDRMIPTR